MKMTTDTREVTRFGDSPTKTFEIEASSMAFDILSSKIYTRVPLAVVRELSTNAWDAHVEAGTTQKPFDVQLPNALVPSFRIRDFGTGLSPEDVESLYTTYFRSRSRDTNDKNGCWGLGSKAPFAYTDQFSVVSWYDGIKYTYSMFKGGDNQPTVSALSAVESDEPAGLEITIPVQQADFVKFYSAASQVYRFFDVCPNILGHQIIIEEPELIFENEWFSTYHGTGNHVLVMGQVGYPISTVNAGVPNPIHGADIHIKAEIGDCQMAVSREELHYDDRSIKYLRAKFTEVKRILKDFFTEQVKDLPTELEKARFLARASGLGITNRRERIDTNVYGAYTLKEVNLNTRSNRLEIRDSWGMYPGDSNRQFVFMDQDCDVNTTSRRRLRSWIENNLQQNQRLYLCRITKRTDFVKVFGEPTIKLSELPKAVVNRRVGISGSRGGYLNFVKRIAGGGISEGQQAWASVEKIPENACVVPRDRYTIKWNDTEIKANTAHMFATILGYDTVLGVSIAHFDRIRDKLGLPNLLEEAKAWATKELAGLTDHQKNAIDGYTDHNFVHKLPMGLSQTCDDLIATHKASKKGWTSLRVAMNVFGLKFDVDNVPDFSKRFAERYPMVDHIPYYASSDEIVKDIVNYIKLVERT